MTKRRVSITLTEEEARQWDDLGQQKWLRRRMADDHAALPAFVKSKPWPEMVRDTIKFRRRLPFTDKGTP